MSEKVVGHLTIKKGEEPLELDVLSGILEKDASLYDIEKDEFVTQKEYSLSIDVDNLSNEIYKDIEEISDFANQLYSITLNIDSKIEEGIASISKAMGVTGLTLDLKITE